MRTAAATPAMHKRLGRALLRRFQAEHARRCGHLLHMGTSRICWRDGAQPPLALIGGLATMWTPVQPADRDERLRRLRPG